MNTQSVHLLVEFHGCDSNILNDPERIMILMEHGVEVVGATIVSRTVHRFSPQGLSVVVVIEESHFSLHSWPETGYAAADFFTCGSCRPDSAVAVVASGINASRTEIIRVLRGRRGGLGLDLPGSGYRGLCDVSQKYYIGYGISSGQSG
ncbi:MAG TPA: adenosylmethionine decarboxylase [Candidatus Kapabacteria bacterium]|nr:adenosylmethionine decarboxylase [Candidatus Kapabacteria bacterium]